MRHIMVDLETLSLGYNAVIASIAAVEFTSDSIGREFYVRVDMADCQKHGMEVDADTVVWWLSQEKVAQAEMINDKRESLKVALNQLSDWMGSSKMHSMLSNGYDDYEDFCMYVLGSKDIPWLENAYKKADIPVPWNYRNAYDYRVLTRFAEEEDYSHAAVTEHHALEDCRWQVKFVQKFCKRANLNL